MIYNASMKIAHLLENEQAVAVFDRFLPGMPPANSSPWPTAGCPSSGRTAGLSFGGRMPGQL